MNRREFIGQSGLALVALLANPNLLTAQSKPESWFKQGESRVLEVPNFNAKIEPISNYGPQGLSGYKVIDAHQAALSGNKLVFEDRHWDGEFDPTAHDLIMADLNTGKSINLSTSLRDLLQRTHGVKRTESGPQNWAVDGDNVALNMFLEAGEGRSVGRFIFYIDSKTGETARISEPGIMPDDAPVVNGNRVVYGARLYNVSDSTKPSTSHLRLAEVGDTVRLRDVESVVNADRSRSTNFATHHVDNGRVFYGRDFLNLSKEGYVQRGATQLYFVDNLEQILKGEKPHVVPIGPRSPRQEYIEHVFGENVIYRVKPAKAELNAQWQPFLVNLRDGKSISLSEQEYDKFVSTNQGFSVRTEYDKNSENGRVLLYTPSTGKRIPITDPSHTPYIVRAKDGKVAFFASRPGAEQRGEMIPGDTYVLNVKK